MKHRILLAAVLLLPLLPGSCMRTAPAAATAPETAAVTKAQNGFSFTYREQAEATGAVRVRYPVITAPVSEGIAAVNGTIAAEMQALLRSAEGGHQATRFIDMRPCRADETLLSFRVESSTEEEGALPVSEISGITFSTQTGQPVALTDVFPHWEAVRSAVGDLIRSRLTEMEKAGIVGTLDWETVTVSIAEDAFGWYFEGGEWVALFAADTVAPGEHNTVTAAISLHLLTDWINPDYTAAPKAEPPRNILRQKRPNVREYRILRHIEFDHPMLNRAMIIRTHFILLYRGQLLRCPHSEYTKYSSIGRLASARSKTK